MGERHTEEMRLLGLTIAFYRRACRSCPDQPYTYEQHRSAKQSYLSVSKQADGYCGSTRNSAENII